MKKIGFATRFGSVLLLLGLILPIKGASAQALAFAEISPPDVDTYPEISTYLNVFDDQGNFVTNMRNGDISVMENGVEISPDTLENLKTPLSFVLAVNSDPALAVRDSYGESRYDKILEILNGWADSLPTDNLDQFALVWNGGVVGSRLSVNDWKSRLSGFDPQARNSTNSLSALAFALDAVQETSETPGSKKAILLISSHLSMKDQNGINDLISRAKQSQVRVYVWITDSNDFQENPGSLVLSDLAAATGGKSFSFTGKELLPNPEEWVGSLRNVYKVTYTSQIRASGKNTLAIQVHTANLALSSPALDFELDIQPPNAILLSPPISIVRQNPEDPFNLDSFTPKNQDISVLIEFPDGKKRNLKRTSLYIDGELVAENTSEPFTLFQWDLSGYIVSAEHILKVEVEDELGLTHTSAEVPVQVTVVQPPGGIAGLILRNRMAITITFVIFAGAVVLVILFLSGRRGLMTLAERRKARAAQIDPVTQPVQIREDTSTSLLGNSFPWLRRKSEPPAAYFVRLSTDGSPSQSDPIPLPGRELTFGTDPTQAMIILDHPSISLLHSRLRHGTDDSFRLFDQNSVAGTWVNYEPVPSEGCILKHGDIINMGMLTYRFVLSKSRITAKPVITPIKSE